MIQLSAAGKRFGHKLLFEDLDWLVTAQDRVGLVGANGTGKSTLLKILSGQETLDYGAISTAKGITAGYLPQEGLNLTGRTVFAECMSVFAELLGIEEELRSLTARMAECDPAGDEYAAIADRYHRLDHEFRARSGYALEAQVGAVLSGLGFSRDDWRRMTDEFSGGWQMRIALAKLLLQKPNLLLLDEPTNHLDLEARNWLEEYLREYPYAFVLISHDRYFLDVTVDRIVEIWNKRVYFYSGNYDKYLEQKQQRKDQLESAFRNQQNKVDQLEAFISRFRYQATKAKQVQSRIKELERMDRVELPPEEEKTIHFSFPQPKPSGRSVVEFKDVAKSYGEKQVLRGVNFVIERGDRIALVGANGAGKSTLIRLLSGTDSLTAGERRVGHNVEIDYFAQDQYKELDPDTRVLDDLEKLSPRATQTELRSLLGCFLFSEDDVFKRIGVLSGGERNRYALARMLMHPSNFLLLDEPTNHLDLRAKDVLLAALEGFSGTVVFVSHDRYFIDKLATRIFEVTAGSVNVFPGNYEDYRWRKEREAESGTGLRGTGVGGTGLRGNGCPQPVPVQPPTLTDVPPEATSDDKKPKRINPIRLKQMETRIAELEEEIARTEYEAAQCESALATFVSAQETQAQTRRLEELRSRLPALMAEWEELSLALDAHA